MWRCIFDDQLCQLRPLFCRQAAAPLPDIKRHNSSRLRPQMLLRGSRRAAMAAVTSSGQIPSPVNADGKFTARSSSSTRHQVRGRTLQAILPNHPSRGVDCTVTGITRSSSFSMQQFHRKVFRVLALCPCGHELPGHPPNCEPICIDVRVIQVL